MKKTISLLMSLVLVFLLGLNVQASEADSEKNSIIAHDDNGVTVYSIDTDNSTSRANAMELLNEYLGDTGKPDNPSRAYLYTFYDNDTESVNSATSYSWKKMNTDYNYVSTVEGGQSTGWFGTGNCDYIILHRNIIISFASFGLSVGFNISNNNGLNFSYNANANTYVHSWTSTSVVTNILGNSFSGLTLSGSTYHIAFYDSGDVYKGSSIYTPIASVGFDVP